MFREIRRSSASLEVLRARRGEGDTLRSTTMTDLRCLHGLDPRFCSICNKPNSAIDGRRRRPVENATLAEIIGFLNHQQVRATYGAVAETLGVIPRSVGALLGPRHIEASWIVNAATGLPTDYGEHEMHPALRRSTEIITSGSELVRRLSAWKASHHR